MVKLWKWKKEQKAPNETLMELRTPNVIRIYYTSSPSLPYFRFQDANYIVFHFLVICLFSDFRLFVSLLCIIVIVNIWIIFITKKKIIWIILFLGCQMCRLILSLIVLLVLGCGRSRVEQLLPKLWLAIGGTPLLYQNRSFISLTNFVYILVGWLASKMIVFYTKSFIACR